MERFSWQKIRGFLSNLFLIAGLASIFAATIFTILAYKFDWKWSGIVEAVTQTQISVVNGKVTTITTTTPGVNFFTCVQVFIIPFALLVFGAALTYYQNKREAQRTAQMAQAEREATEQRAIAERSIALDNQQEAGLLAYFACISSLLLDRNLRTSAEDDEVRNIARTQTLSVLLHLDGARKARVIRFLYESGLIKRGQRVIDLSGADLREADLRGAILFGADRSVADLREADLRLSNLIEADLRGAILIEADFSRGAILRGADLRLANLIGADLSGANLSKADLRGANLSGADFRFADLRGANLSGAVVTPDELESARSLEGAIMPDGSIHP